MATASDEFFVRFRNWLVVGWDDDSQRLRQEDEPQHLHLRQAEADAASR